MEVKIYEISKDRVRFIPYTDFDRNYLSESSVYIYDIVCKSRQDAQTQLQHFNFSDVITDGILQPAENIRFDFYRNVAYGELGYFSSNSKDPIHYIGVISERNLLITIRYADEKENIMEVFLESYSKIQDEKKSKPEVKLLLYLLVVEIVTIQGKLLLKYREKIEDIAKEFSSKICDIGPSDFLQAKAHIADFGKVIEQLYFSLYFPPVRNILDHESPYRKYFEELIRTVEMLKESQTQAEQRLNSLHDHFLLLLQEKSNRRINFLTIIQAIFVPLTLLAGIYGMNFANMPELNTKYGYFVVLISMSIIAVVFIRYFYKKGWFE